jgi:hypothetical protein
MKRRNARSRKASPLGVLRMRHVPNAASMMVAATPSGVGAFWMLFATAWDANGGV